MQCFRISNQRLQVETLMGILCSAAFVLVLGINALGAAPHMIHYQGILKGNNGNPVPDTSYTLTFTIYDSTDIPPGTFSNRTSNALWTETQLVNTSGGMFNVLLGSTNSIPDSAFSDTLRFLGIQVGADPEMTPRQRLASVGYSYVSNQWSAGSSGSPKSDNVAVSSPSDDLYRLNGNVGIGTSMPFSKLDVLNINSDPFSTKSIQGQVENSSSGDAYAGYFATSVAGTGSHYGVYGNAGSSSSGTSYGGYFAGNSSLGISYGVFADGASYGVYAQSSIGTGAYAISTANEGYGLVGVGDEAGVAGLASGSGNRARMGVFGRGRNDSLGDAMGVFGDATSYDSDGDAYGGWFSGTQSGVGAGIGYGILAWGDTIGGMFIGDIVATGTKSAAVKTNNGQYHLLYALESTENWFEDFGTAQLKNGVVTVSIDPLFIQTVNTSVGYHVFLTPKGDCQGLYVTNESPSSFEIRELQNGKSDLSVSYRIVAKRKGYEEVRMGELVGATPEELRAKGAKLQEESANAKTVENDGKIR